jgi:hypothetical protein
VVLLLIHGPARRAGHRALGSIVLMIAVTSCARDRGASPRETYRQAGRAWLRKLDVARRNRLEYRVETRADNTEVWEVDEFLFALMDRNTDKLWMLPDGKRFPGYLRASEAVDFLAKHPEIDSMTYVRVDVRRLRREIKGRRDTLIVLGWMTDDVFSQIDIDALISKDAADWSRRQSRANNSRAAPSVQ